MDRNNGSNRFTSIRRGGQQPQHQSASASSSSSSLSSTSNNNQQHMDNHHRQNSSTSTLTSASQYSTSNMTSAYASSQASTMSRDALTQHDELIRYIREAWTKVNEQGTPVIYRNESDHQLKNFKPFNLEEYWDQRHFQNIHVSHGQQ